MVFFVMYLVFLNDRSSSVDHNDLRRKVVGEEKLALQYVIPGSGATLAAFLINVGFIVVGVQSLKKTFHNLLVLLLCLNDGMLCLFSAVHTILKGIPVGQRSHIICGGFLVVIGYGFLTSFVIIFMLGFARFVRIRTLNHNIMYRLEKYKCPILVLTHLASLSLVLIIHVSTQETRVIKACNPADFYGRNYKIYILCLVVPISLLVVAIVLVYTLCGYFLWQLFFKGKDKKTKDFILSNKIAPSKYIVDVDEDAKPDHENVTPPWIETTPGPSHLSNDIQLSDLEKIKDIVDGENQEECPKTVHSVDSENQEEGPVTMPREMGIDWSGGSARLSPNKTKIQQDMWEVRAFKTSLLVASTTVCLSVPFITTILYDLFAYDTMPVKIRHVVLTLNGISYFLDPFIYAFRVPEIRREIKKKFSRH